MRLAFDLLEDMEQLALPSEGEPPPVCRGPEESRRRKVEFSLCLTVELGHCPLLPSAFLVLRPELESTPSVLWLSGH